MSVRLFYLLIISLLTIGSGCKRTPTYPETPSIEFSRVERYLVNSSLVASGVMDSIVVTVNFKDGDGDLGMELHGPPYLLDVVQYNAGNIIKYNGNPVYSCENYSIDYYDTDALIDTVLIVKEPHYYNYFIELLVKQSNGTYLPYVFPNCGSINGRFPPLAPQNYKGPIEGSLSFTINNTLAFQSAPLKNKTIKFRVNVEDHAFNKSNIVETSDIVLNY